MAKWIRLENRRKGQKFRCPHCGRVCYCKPSGGGGDRTTCDYLFCPYCGEKVDTEQE